MGDEYSNRWDQSPQTPNREQRVVIPRRHVESQYKEDLTRGSLLLRPGWHRGRS